MLTTAEAQSAQLTPQFDRSALKVNQTLIIGLLAVAFLVDSWWIVATVAAVMALGTFDARMALFQRFYRDVLRPAGVLKPDLHAEAAAPHRFAQGMGAGVLILALLAFVVGFTSLGWGLTLLVIVLAAVNLFFGFCAGCFVYYQLGRLRHTG
ncbi:DUF4395 domain-containing protein [Candidatus Gracilibacteria bacterium]|nr:DUF4395 domain-containing protein [Candidatus Gracilibacteria bacterium]